MSNFTNGQRFEYGVRLTWVSGGVAPQASAGLMWRGVLRRSMDRPTRSMIKMRLNDRQKLTEKSLSP